MPLSPRSAVNSGSISSRMSHIEGLDKRVEETLALVRLGARADWRVSDLAYGEKRRLEIGLALATQSEPAVAR